MRKTKLLIWWAAAVLAFSQAAFAQFAGSGTTSVAVNVGAEAALQVNTGTTNLTTSGATFAADYLGATSFSYKIRTSKSGGTGTITLAATGDFGVGRSVGGGARQWKFAAVHLHGVEPGRGVFQRSNDPPGHGDPGGPVRRGCPFRQDRERGQRKLDPHNDPAAAFRARWAATRCGSTPASCGWHRIPGWSTRRSAKWRISSP